MKMLYNQGIPSKKINSKFDDYFLEDLSYPLSRSDLKNETSKDFQEFLSQQNFHVRNFKNEINKLHFQINETVGKKNLFKRIIKRIIILLPQLKKILMSRGFLS